jgi:hypothetical protein
MSSWNDRVVFVVYRCNNEWHRFSAISYRTRRRKFGNPGPARPPHGAVTTAHVLYIALIALVILWILAHWH